MKKLLILILLSSVGCGSVQTINGVRIKDRTEKPVVKNYILVTVISFGFGTYLGKEVLPQKKQ